MNNIGFIGLGVMGAPMAGHLSQKGYNLSVFNRSADKSKLWKSQYKGVISSSLNDLALNSDVIILCVKKDEDVRNIINEIKDSIKPNSIVIDHTTTSAELAKEMHNILKEKQSSFLDAPVSGGEAGAKLGKLSIMVGGDKDIFSSASNILSCYSKFTKYMGPSGHGQLTKMVNQICIAGLIQALAEGLNFSEKAGLNSSDVIEVISQGAAQSWQMENRWETMLADQYEHGFAVDLMRKDLEIVKKQAELIGANIEVTKLVNNFYKDIQDIGGGNWDTSSLLKRLQD
ncbi:MAG: NAD(P)-dependent oxidoreductase [Proteobacteria bacterium]|nr:NAD(P)-dependent oxidoreductase [Pseudomonadota bacterium]